MFFSLPETYLNTNGPERDSIRTMRRCALWLKTVLEEEGHWKEVWNDLIRKKIGSKEKQKPISFSSALASPSSLGLHRTVFTVFLSAAHFRVRGPAFLCLGLENYSSLPVFVYRTS